MSGHAFDDFLLSGRQRLSAFGDEHGVLANANRLPLHQRCPGSVDPIDFNDPANSHRPSFVKAVFTDHAFAFLNDSPANKTVGDLRIGDCQRRRQFDFFDHRFRRALSKEPTERITFEHRYMDGANVAAVQILVAQVITRAADRTASG